MYEHNQHRDSNNNNSKIDKKFLDALYEFIHSVKFELDTLVRDVFSSPWLLWTTKY